jgi:hypothetical protein
LVHVGIDAMGFIPPARLGTKAVGAVGRALGYRGIVATQQGTKAIEGFQKARGLIFAGAFSGNQSTTGIIATTLSYAEPLSAVAGFAPVVGQVFTGLLVATDVYDAATEIARCK